MLRIHPDGLTNEIIQNIGKDYLNRFGEEPGLFHKNHPVAKMLRAYDKESTVEDKWYFLANTYAQLRENGMLSSDMLGMAIANLAMQAFQQPIYTSYGDLQPTRAGIAARMKEIIKIYSTAKEMEDLKATIHLLAKNQK